MKKEVLLTKKMYEKKTKTTYKLISSKLEEITINQHEMGTSKECMRFFKRFDGSFKRTFEYTKAGYKCTKVVSISPDKQKKSIIEYKFL